MSHIFISYSRKDLDSAEKIVNALAKDNLETWIDWKNIPPGEQFTIEIKHGIEGSDVFLFLISPDSVKSDWCEKEIIIALNNGKRIVPILIRNTEIKEIKELSIPLSSINWIACRDGFDDFDTSIEKIQTAIRTDYAWLRYHTKLQVKSLDWERRRDDSRLLRGKELQEAEQQLASIGSKKDPQPTDLQRQFVLESRKAEQNRQRTTTRVIIGVSIVLCFLCVLALTGGSVAYLQSNAKSTAQVQAATAQVQAGEQGNIALARKLATQAQSLSLEQGNTATLSGLLAIEATKRFPHLEADQAMRNYLNVAAYPISSMKHDDQIFSVAFSPIGDKIATGSIDGTIRVWDVETGQEIKRITVGTYVYHVAFSPNGKWLLALYCDQMEESLPGRIYCINLVAHVLDTNNWKESSRMAQGNSVNSVAFSPDSESIVSGGNDGTVIVWDVATGKEIAHMKHGETEFGVSVVAFSPDGKLIVSGSPDHTAIVWDVATSNEIAKLVDEGEVDFVSFSPDSKRVVSGGHDVAPIVWEAYSGKEITRMNYDKSVDSSTFSPDGSLIVSNDNSTIMIWNASTGQLISSMHTNSSSSGIFSPDGKEIFSVGGLAQIWDAATGVELSRMVLDVQSVGFSPDGTRVAFTNPDGTMHIGEFASKQESASMIHNGSVESVVFSPNGKWVASGSMDGTTRVWYVESGKEISRMTIDGLVLTIDISSNSEWIAQGACEGQYVACGNPVVRIWEALTGKEVYQLHPDFAIRVVKFTPDGRNIVLAGDHGSIQLWNLVSGKMVSEYKPDLTGAEAAGRAGSFIETMDVSSNGKWIVAGSVVAAEVWELNSTRKVYKMDLDGGISAIAFSPSGKWVASVGSNIRVWNPESGEELIMIPLQPVNSGVSSLAFSPDEKWLVIGSGTTIQVREISTGREVSQITTNIVNTVEFSPDGKWIASGNNYDNTAQVWLWRPEDLISEVCKRLTRNLTHEEWKQFIGNEPYGLNNLVKGSDPTVNPTQPPKNEKTNRGWRTSLLAFSWGCRIIIISPGY